MSDEGGKFYPAQRAALGLAVEYVMGTGVAGDIVEFGCYRGMTAVMLAQALVEMDGKYGYSDRSHGIAQRRLWVLDSFQDFPEARDPIDAASPHIKAGVWYAGQPAGGSAEEVHRRCAYFIGAERVSVIAGWYKDTLCLLPAGSKFALVHVDCDYYESTRQVLDHLFTYDMLSDGCTILFDDWYCNRGSPQFGEQRAWREAVASRRAARGNSMSFTDWGPYGVVGRRFIVHHAEAT